MDGDSNAKHVTRCVNTHDALIAALREMIPYFRHDGSDEANALIKRARAALAAAEGN